MTASPYAVPLSDLDSSRVAVTEQVQGQGEVRAPSESQQDALRYGDGAGGYVDGDTD